MTEAVQFMSSVEQIMKIQVSTVTVDQSISTVKDIVEANGGDPVPVIRADNTLVGVITVSDVMVDSAATAGQLASHPRMTVAPHESAFSVATRMLNRRVDWVPVVSNRKLVGTITRRCILSAFGELHSV